MLTQTLAFIGGGNMTRSLVGGLVAKGLDPKQVVVADRNADKRAALEASFHIRTSADIHAAATAQIVVLAIKPQQLREVAEALAPDVAGHRPLLISVAAGLRCAQLEQWLGLPVVRAMPNRPALLGCGITGLYAGSEVPSSHRAVATTIMSAVGKAVWLEREQWMDALTAVSGSGPAYFFLLMELLEAAGVAQGLPADVARTLAVETAYGAGLMAHDAHDPPATLREQVTSKGGTTAAALRVFADGQLAGLVNEAVAAATARSAELAEALAK